MSSSTSLSVLAPPAAANVGRRESTNWPLSQADEVPPGFVERAHSCDSCQADHSNKCVPNGNPCRRCQVHNIECIISTDRKLARSCFSCQAIKSVCMAGSFTRCLRCITLGTKCYMRDYQTPVVANRVARRKFLHYDPKTDGASAKVPKLARQVNVLSPKRPCFTNSLSAANFDLLEPLFIHEASLLVALLPQETSLSVAPSALLPAASSLADYVSPYAPQTASSPLPTKARPSSTSSTTANPSFSAPIAQVMLLPPKPVEPPILERPPALTHEVLEIASPLPGYFQPGFIYPEPYYTQPAYPWAPYAYPPVTAREDERGL